MAEGGPADAVARPVDYGRVAVALGEQAGQIVVHGVGGQPFAPLHALVHLQLKRGQGGHDQEVAVEVRHRLFDDGDLQVAADLLVEQVAAQHGLVEVRRHLGGEEGVVGVDPRLVLPRQPGVHRVAQLVG